MADLNLMGLALAGGKSTRMGSCKALAKPWGPVGPTMLEHCFELLSSVARICYVSCARGKPFAGFPCIEDRHNLEGPLRGIAAGLEKARELGYSAVLALACDLPLMTAATLAALWPAHEHEPQKAVLYANAETGKIEPLAGIYPVCLLPVLWDGINRGEASLFRLIGENQRILLEYGQGEARYFYNCNSPEELAQAGLQPPCVHWQMG